MTCTKAERLNSHELPFACKKDVISTSRQHSSNRLQWAQSRHPAMGWPNRKHPPPKSMSLLEPFGNP